MLDLVVRSDRVVTPHGVGAYDVAIQGDKIVAVATPDTLTGDVTRTVDATGKIVVPGGIDPHTHCHWPVPFPGGPTTLSAGPEAIPLNSISGNSLPELRTAVAHLTRIPPLISLSYVGRR